MKKTYLLGALILGILAVAVAVVALSVTGMLGSDDQLPLVFTTESQSKTYDAEPLTNNKWTLASGELKEGHRVVPTIYGEQTNAGVSENKISVKILDENDADVTGDYRIEYRPGKLTVLQKSIKIASDSATKQYDGEPLSCETYKIVSGKLLSGHRLSVEFGIFRTEVGVSENIITARILDKAGNDVTANYGLETLNGSLHISGYPLTVKTNSDEKVYDGTPLKIDGYEILSGELKGQDKIAVTVLGEQTEAGEGKNNFVVHIYDENDNDVTRFYDISSVEGTLTVFKRELTVASGSKNVAYGEVYQSGGTLTYDNYQVSDNLAPGHTANVTINGIVEGVGEGKNTFFVVILDENENPVTQNYEIIKEEGDLRILPVDIAITTRDAYISYDQFVAGNKEPLVCNEYDESIVGLLEGHRVVIDITGKQASVGKSENKFTVKIVDRDEKDVTSLYLIEKIYGELEIGPIELTLGSSSATKEYDGTSLEKNGEGDWWIASGALYPGHEIVKAVMSTSITNVDRVPNEVTLTIFDENGLDVTHCYTLTSENLGYLEITPLSLFVTSESYSDMYDGEAVRHEIYHMTGGYDELIARGHTIEVFFIEYPIEAGEYQNEMDYIIRDANGTEITENYVVKENVGKITITPRVLTIRTESDSKIYDGVPLINHNWKVVSETQVLEGHRLIVSVSGEQTEIGKSENFVAELRVVTDDEEERDVTLNYDLTGLQLGVLTVKDPSSNGGGIEDPGIPPDGYDGETKLLAKIKSTATGSVYLKEMSFGDYNGQGFDLAKSYNQCIDDRFGMGYLTALALGRTESNQKMDIEFLDTRYFLPYYLDVEEADYKEQTSDVFYKDASCVDASLYYYNYWYTSDNPPPVVPDEYKDVEEAYRKYVYDTYLDMTGHSKTVKYLQSVIDREGFSKDDPHILKKVAEFIQTCAKYNLKYDGSLDNEDDVVIAFMEEYKEGVCRHYAMSATLLLRTLGIPARYTVGLYSEIKTAGEWVEVKSNTGHAWTEVYIDGTGWVALEVTGSDRQFPQDGDDSTQGGGGGGGSGDGVIKLEITPIVQPLQYYEGAVLTATPENTTFTGNEDFRALIERGYKVVCDIEGSINEVGYGPINISNVQILNLDGENILEDEDSYKLDVKEGKLHLYEKALTVSSGSVVSEYTGDYVSCHTYENTNLIDDSHYLELTFNASRRDAGNTQNYFVCKVYQNVDGEKKDVTYKYLISKTYGEIVVKPIYITLTADQTQLTSAELEALGGTYEASAFTLDGELFATHQFAIVEQSGSLSGRGRQETIITDVKIVDENGRDVTSNYSIVFKKGLIRVTR